MRRTRRSPSSTTTCRPPTAASPIPIRKAPSRSPTLAQNAKDFGIEYFDEFDKRQGIVHIIGPEQGFTLPGTTIVCGDSHTATHGAFGALAYGIGTSEVEHVLATQTLIQTKSKNMRAVVDGKLPPGVTAKDIILAIIGEIGTAGGTGYALEYAGEAIRAISIEGRMTICNMSVEGGAKAGFIAPDEKAFAYLKDKPKAPKGKAWDEAMRYWETLQSDEGAHFDREIRLDAAKLPPLVTWGTSPEQVMSITGRVPVAAEIADEKKRIAAERSLDYMGLKGGEKITDIKLDRVFIGSCTNGRIEDLRDVARVVAGQDGQRQRQRHDRAGLRPGEGAGGSRRPRQDLQGRRLRLARAGLLDVPRHESGQAGAGRALRLDLEPQLRRPPGLQGPHPPGVAGDGGGGRDRRTFRRRAGVEVARRQPAKQKKAAIRSRVYQRSAIYMRKSAAADLRCFRFPDRLETEAEIYPRAGGSSRRGNSPGRNRTHRDSHKYGPPYSGRNSGARSAEITCAGR